jgi:hypothetical protein
MKVQLVQMVENQLVSTVFQNVEDALAGFEIRGFKFVKLSRSYEDARPGAAVPRKELWNQPQFAELLGPMWGGDEGGIAILRYEDQKSYDVLST